jgi:hypothetical protein
MEVVYGLLYSPESLTQAQGTEFFTSEEPQETPEDSKTAQCMVQRC